MCVIIVKPVSAKAPTEEELEKAFDYNPDGSGYMFVRNKNVVIKKGFMTFNAFYKSFKKDLISNHESPFVIHFRITTQGGVKKQLCHPYPLSKDLKELRKLSTTCEIGIAHNGITSLTSESNSYYDAKSLKYVLKEPNYNDTMKFITEYLSLIIKSKDYYKDNDKIELISKLCKSKLCILDNDMHIELIGDFIEHNGCYYSNLNHLQERIFYDYSSYYDKVDEFGLTEYDYECIEEDYEDFWNKKTKLYDFNSTTCPLAYYNTDKYCDMCSNEKCICNTLYQLNKIKQGK